jgi:thioredoxin 1
MSDSKDSTNNSSTNSTKSTHAVIEVNSVEELDSFLSLDSTDPLVVLDWSAEWCGPCKRIAPDFEKLAKEETSVKFLHADIDELEETATKMGISSVPTFLFFKKGVQIDKVSGANISLIKNAVSKHK